LGEGEGARLKKKVLRGNANRGESLAPAQGGLKSRPEKPRLDAIKDKETERRQKKKWPNSAKLELKLRLDKRMAEPPRIPITSS